MDTITGPELSPLGKTDHASYLCPAHQYQIQTFIW